MNDRYIFDKRVIKKLFIKYLIIFIALLPILVLVNTLLKDIGSTTIVLIDVAVGLAFIFLVEVILGKLQKKREEKLKTQEKSVKISKKDDEAPDIIEITDIEVRSGKDKKTNNEKDDK